MNHQARKRFGQNFLVDRGVVAAIVAAIAPHPGEVLVEIGPGLGALTEPLLQAMPKQVLHVVELDRDLAARLQKSPHAARLSVHQADALQFDFAGLVVPPQKLRVCGNLPYNISSPLLFHLLESIGSVADQHFMLQKEVVERMTATPGGKEYGRLSVMLQVHYDMGLLFDVAPESFDPPPRVDSAVVRMVPRKTPLLPPEHQTVFARLVMQAFSQRRKMLRNTLRDYASHLATLDIAPTVRAEDVAVTQYVALAASVYGEQTDR